jgi:hypothetical protein
MADRAADLMEQHGAQDVDEHAREWRSSGWSGPSHSHDTQESGLNPGASSEYKEGVGFSVPTKDRGIGTRKQSKPASAIRPTGLSPRRPARMYPYTGDLSIEARPDDTPTSLRNTPRYETATYDYREHFGHNYASRGNYSDYEPAYTFGSSYAGRYRDREWHDIEPEVRSDWERDHQGTWEDFKDAVRHGWEKVRGRR